MDIALSEVVGQFLNSADQSSQQYRRLYNIAKFGLKTEFNLDITGVMKTVLLEVSANKTVRFPDELISYTKIGVRKNPASGSLNWSKSIKTLVEGDYTIKREERMIYLNPELFYSEIVLQGLLDGEVDGCEDAVFDIEAGSAMLAYIRWQDAIDQRKKFSPSAVNMLKRDFYTQKRLAKMRINPTRPYELIHALNTGTDSHTGAGSGGSLLQVTDNSPEIKPKVILFADFEPDGVTVNDPLIKNIISMDVNGIGILIPVTDYQVLSTGGFRISFTGFTAVEGTAILIFYTS